MLDATQLPLAQRLREALRAFDRQLRGFVTEEAIVVGVESRTSSPVRVPRDATTLVSPDLAGLYPCAEGAGYAGGIVSAALDGMRVARAVLAPTVSWRASEVASRASSTTRSMFPQIKIGLGAPDRIGLPSKPPSLSTTREPLGPQPQVDLLG